MIHSFIFSEGRLVGRDLEVEALRLVRVDKGLLLWVDLDNPGEEEVKQILEGVFQFHPLAIEDCVTPSSLPKVEDYDDYLFLVMHAVDFSRTEKFSTTELDLFLGKDYLVTYHRTPLHSVQTIIDRMTKNPGVIARAPDRIAHSILDLLADNYTPVVSELRGELEHIEEAVLSQTSGGFIQDILQLRGEIHHLREIISPQRDVINRLAHGESKLVRALMLPYFRDLRDKLLRIDETAASYTEQLLISFDLFLSKSAFEANEGIKVLTALTALTVPATVVGTWYGMNFEHMPELRSPYGYLGAWIVTLGCTAWIWRWCKRKKWI
ncbi:MAG: magnesium/cobalt transporter CorA [Opitutaceae bacterium]|nr:magnesium/cobalt transporter CorA [Opitutaceae bacterium]